MRVIGLEENNLSMQGMDIYCQEWNITHEMGSLPTITITGIIQKSDGHSLVTAQNQRIEELENLVAHYKEILS